MSQLICARVAAALMLLVPIVSQVAAQDTEAEKAYVAAMSSVLEMWNTKQIILAPKDSLQKQFDERLSVFRKKQKDNDLEAIVPSDFIESNWGQLPSKISPELPLSTGAKWVLIGGVLDAADRLQKDGVPSDPASFQKALELSLYLTLGAAQEEARKANEGQIDSVSVRRAGVRFFSLGWPLCCGEE